MSPLPVIPPAIVVLIPFLGAAAIALAARAPAWRDALCWLAPVPFFIGVVSLLGPVVAGDYPGQTLLTLAPGLDLTFRVRPLGMTFALLASSLWLVATPYALGYMKAGGYTNLSRFMACYAIALGAAAGIAFAGDLLTLYVFYEVLSVSTYPLVAHTGTDKARAGGRTYLALLLVTSVGMMLPAIIWVWHATGDLTLRPGGMLAGHVDPLAGAALLVLFVFGAGKAAVMPFHRWLPAAMVAPTPVSALLHAVAVVKAGVFVMLTVAVYVFGLDYLASLVTATPLLYAAVFTMLAASLVALHKDNLKARLAYSTVSQLSYIVVGALVASPWGAVGGGLHMLMHGFGKITLFFCAGAIYLATKKSHVSELDGIGRRMPFTMTAFLVGAVCVIGLPPTGGVWSKWHLIRGAMDAGHYPVVAAFVLSTLLNIGYLLPPVMRAFLREGPAPEGDARLQEAPWLCVVPLCLTAAGTLVLFVLAHPALALLGRIFP